jgi:tetratricopeptide (TPR) repeat protein
VDWFLECTQAIKLQPGYIEAYFLRANTRVELGDRKGGIEDLEQALKFAPDNKIIAKRLTELRSAIGK